MEGGMEMNDVVINVLVTKLTDNNNEGIIISRTDVYGVDDDNEPDPENIPTDQPNLDQNSVTWEGWDILTAYNRRSEGY